MHKQTSLTGSGKCDLDLGKPGSEAAAVVGPAEGAGTSVSSAPSDLCPLHVEKDSRSRCVRETGVRMNGSRGGEGSAREAESPCHLSPQPAATTASRGSISLARNALHSPTLNGAGNLLLGKNGLKEVIFTSHVAI